MQGIEQEIKEFRNLSIEEDGHKNLVQNLDKTSKAMAKAILDILEISEISVTNAKVILHLCEDIIERCTPVSIKKDSTSQ